MNIPIGLLTWPPPPAARVLESELPEWAERQLAIPRPGAGRNVRMWLGWIAFDLWLLSCGHGLALDTLRFSYSLWRRAVVTERRN